MVAIDLPNPRRLAYGVVLGQAVVTGIAAPISSFVNVLAAVPRSLVVALDQVRQQKEASS